MLETYTFSQKNLLQKIEIPDRGVSTFRLFQRKTDEQLQREEEEAK